MAGTPYETPLYIFGSGQPGEIITVLGGVHGNEPGGWLAAERIVEHAAARDRRFARHPPRQPRRH